MNPTIRLIAKHAAVDEVVAFIKTNGRKLVHVASDTQVHRATIDLTKAMSSSWREAGPATAPTGA
jgi:hypothetical protein